MKLSEYIRLSEDFIPPAPPAMDVANQVAVSDTATASDKSNADAMSATDLGVIKDLYRDDTKCTICGNLLMDCDCDLEECEEDVKEAVSKTPAELKLKKKNALKKKKELIRKIGASEFNKRLKKAAKYRNKSSVKAKIKKNRIKYNKTSDGKKAKKLMKKRLSYESVEEAIIKKEKIIGGKADFKTLDDIAKIHNVSLDFIKSQFNMGVEVEFEHTNDRDIASEIAKDHLMELPDYYTRLEKMENE